MFYFRFFLVGLLLWSCKNDVPKTVTYDFSEADSLAVTSEIFDSLRAEYSKQWFVDRQGCFIGYFPPFHYSQIDFELKNNCKVYRVNSSEPLNISQEVVSFFSSSDKKDKINPVFVNRTIGQTINEIVTLREEIRKLKLDPKTAIEILEYKQSVLSETEYKLQLLDLLNTDRIKEINENSGVRLFYFRENECTRKVFDSLLLGFYQLREIDSKKYFGQSYAKIFWLGLHKNDSLSTLRTNALNFLNPVQVIDMKKDNFGSSVPLPPE